MTPMSGAMLLLDNHGHVAPLPGEMFRAVPTGGSGVVLGWVGREQRCSYLSSCAQGKGQYRQHYGFSSGHIQTRELDHEEGWVLKNWCSWMVVLEKTLERPSDCKEIKPVNPKANQPWIVIGRTDAEAEALKLWPSDVKSSLTWKDTDAGKDWGKRRR